MIRRRVRVSGIVQGVGFRPFVYREATRRGLSGFVRNETGTVVIEVQGDPDAVHSFLAALRESQPPLARVVGFDVSEAQCVRGATFSIVESQSEAMARPVLPPDVATCAECLDEVNDRTTRRHAYPFTNCTNCGPRYSIARKLPYDRATTSMSGFQMCAECEREYRDVHNRRFHAEPIACPRCGPKLSLVDASGVEVARGGEALSAAARGIRAGNAVALKGLGGFQLLVDATDGAAVARLRARKRRPSKPFAVMVADVAAAKAICRVSTTEGEALGSPAAPIVLLARLRGEALVASGVAPGNPYLGVMLPTTPLHHLLLARARSPVVCTSGNLSEEPICVETYEALDRLRGLADLFLVHDRPIVRPVDDSVGRCDARGFNVIRRARGFAPAPIKLGTPGPVVLALGGHQKGAIALAIGDEAVVSQHLGDLDSALGEALLERTANDFAQFFDARPEAIACDLHPDYASTRLGEVLAARWGARLIRVQHHHAHVASCVAEHGLAGPVLGLAWDGAGYGADGTTWGGEALVCDGGSFSRIGHLGRFPLPGGERVAREPRRSALGLLSAAIGVESAIRVVTGFGAGELRALAAVLGRPEFSPQTSSMGRLFDAVAALLGLCEKATFEGEAAMRVEFAAMEEEDGDCGAAPNDRGIGEDAAYEIPVDAGVPAVGDWRPLVGAVLRDVRRRESIAGIATRFSGALARLAVSWARVAGVRDVVLTGGCFQNALLTRLAREGLSNAGFVVHTHAAVPPNDGGIALGQAAVARALLR